MQLLNQNISEHIRTISAGKRRSMQEGENQASYCRRHFFFVDRCDQMTQPVAQTSCCSAWPWAAHVAILRSCPIRLKYAEDCGSLFSGVHMCPKIFLSVTLLHRDKTVFLVFCYRLQPSLHRSEQRVYHRKVLYTHWLPCWTWCDCATPHAAGIGV